MNCIVVAGTWREFDFSQSAFYVETKTNAIEPLRLNGVITLLVRVGTWLHGRLFHFFIPKRKLFSFALRVARPSLFDKFNRWIKLVCVTFIGCVVINFDVPLEIASALVVFITVSKSARLFVLHGLEFRVSLYVIHVPFVLISS